MMRTVISLLVFQLCVWINIYAQADNFQIDGAIQISSSQILSPKTGTIRWTGSDFEGRNDMTWVSLTPEPNTVRDIDHNVYKTVKIGTQIWMAENLKVTRYNDGSAISFVPITADWVSLDEPGYSSYYVQHNDYGMLYNFEVVDTTNGLNACPMGWHIPSNAEWDTLNNFLGGSSIAGGKMKQPGIFHWASPNQDANNTSGFSGLPGGYRKVNGFFTDIGSTCIWWSSSKYGMDAAFSWSIKSSDGTFTQSSEGIKRGHSIRCVKND